jgi:hypothetical protein
MTGFEGFLLAFTIATFIFTIVLFVHISFVEDEFSETQDRHFSILSRQLEDLRSAHNNIHISTYEKLADTRLKGVSSGLIQFHNGVMLSEEDLAREVVTLLEKDKK